MHVLQFDKHQILYRKIMYKDYIHYIRKIYTFDIDKYCIANVYIGIYTRVTNVLSVYLGSRYTYNILHNLYECTYLFIDPYIYLLTHVCMYI